MLLLNRLNISKKNLKYFSDKNGAFVYYSNQQIQKHLNCSDKTATHTLNKLQQAGLIRKEYQKRGLPLKIYVNDVFGIHNRTYNKDKPPQSRNQNFRSYSPAVPEKAEKEVSFDMDKIDEMSQKHLFTFAEKKKKRKPN